MTNQSVIVGIDVGTTKICTLIGETSGDSVQVVGVGVSPARGIRKGIVVGMEEAAGAIATSIKKAETFSGYKIVGAHVAVSGGHLASQPVEASLAMSGRRPVSRQDASQVLDQAKPDEVGAGRQIIHLLPKGYVVDGEAGINSPVGMLASSLEVEGLLVTGGKAPLGNLASCVERAGIHLDGIVAGGLASSHAVLTAVERKLGVLLIDIGGGTTDLAWVRQDNIQYLASLPFGGNHITNDLSMVLGVPFAAAEDLKVRFASAVPSSILEDEMVDAGGYSDGEVAEISRRLMAEVVEARVSELLDLAMEELDDGGFDGVLPAGVVLTGGSAQLRGLREYIQDRLKVPVRVGEPEGLNGPMDSVVSPAYASGVGLLKWVLAQPNDLAESRPIRRGGAGVGGRLKSMIRAFFP
jgi:cell division protein FtsA